MNNIILFIRRFFNLICFVILQVMCFVMLSRYSQTHEAFFSTQVNQYTGQINKQYNAFYAYFGLQTVNRELAQENALLKNKLYSSYFTSDSAVKFVVDSTLKDTTGRFRKFTFIPALVVNNSINLQNNYITLEKGTAQGVKKGMGVIGPLGIVGEVVAVSNNYSVVMSLLNRNSKVSAMLKKDNVSGSVEWDGVSPTYVTLKNIPKSSKVFKGDTVLTSTYSSKFPSHLMVGTVVGISADIASNSYILKLKTATDFYSLQHLYIVQNVRYEEQTQLEGSIRQKNNE